MDSLQDLWEIQRITTRVTDGWDELRRLTPEALDEYCDAASLAVLPPERYRWLATTTEEQLDPLLTILPQYRELRDGLSAQYDLLDTWRLKDQHSRREAQGARAFTSTFIIALKKTEDGDAALNVYGALEDALLGNTPGELSWEMRRFIRNAPPQYVGEFGLAVQRLVRRDPAASLGMGDFWYQMQTADGERAHQLARHELYHVARR